MNPVASPLIPRHWPRIWSLIEPSVTRGGEHNERSVLAALLHGGFVLWCDAKEIADARTFIVTSWCDYPAGRIGYVQFAGGRGMDAWLAEAIAAFRAWANAMGCKELRVVGRKGWARWLKRAPTDFTYREILS